MSSQIEELKSFIVAIVLKRNIQYNQRLQHREIGAVFLINNYIYYSIKASSEAFLDENSGYQHIKFEKS